jgi:cytosine permease
MSGKIAIRTSVRAPLSERRGVLYPAFVWSGFTAVFSCLIIGNRLHVALGTIDAAIAVVLGSWLLFLYSAAIGFACGRWGLNFQIMLKASRLESVQGQQRGGQCG